MSWGRGGAGNIGMGEEASRRAAEDTEAADSAAAAAPSAASPASPTSTSSQPPQEYAHMGRGGAGNYYSPAALAHTGATSDTTAHSTPTAEPPLKDLASSSNTTTSNNPSSSTPATSATAPTSAGAAAPETPIARTGRGGAGNFVWGGGSERAAERVRAQHEDRRRREDAVRQSVQADVERGLPRPGRAFLGEGNENAAAAMGMGRERLR